MPVFCTIHSVLYILFITSSAISRLGNLPAHASARYQPSRHVWTPVPNATIQTPYSLQDSTKWTLWVHDRGRTPPASSAATPATRPPHHDRTAQRRPNQPPAGTNTPITSNQSKKPPPLHPFNSSNSERMDGNISRSNPNDQSGDEEEAMHLALQQTHDNCHHPDQRPQGRYQVHSRKSRLFAGIQYQPSPGAQVQNPASDTTQPPCREGPPRSEPRKGSHQPEKRYVWKMVPEKISQPKFSILISWPFYITISLSTTSPVHAELVNGYSLLARIPTRCAEKTHPAFCLVYICHPRSSIS